MTCISKVPDGQVQMVAGQLKGFGLVNITITPDGNGTSTVCGEPPGAGGPMRAGATRPMGRTPAPPKGLREKMTLAAFTKLTGGSTKGTSGAKRPGGSKSGKKNTRSAGRAKTGGRKKSGTAATKTAKRSGGGRSRRRRAGGSR